MKILILFSGGLDSLTMKRYADVMYPDAEVTCVYYDLGQEYAHKEMAVLPSFVEKLKLDWLDQNTTSKGKDGSASGSIYIPGRNLALAVNAACKYLPDEVWMGALLGETHDNATDKNWEFLNRASETLSYVLSPFKPSGVKVRFPLAEGGFNKLTATKWALEHGISKEEVLRSSSCLSGEEGNCGSCIVCFRRWGIFRQLGFEENYNVHPLLCEENLEVVLEMMYGTHYDFHRQEEILPALPDWYRELAEDTFQHKKCKEQGLAPST